MAQPLLDHLVVLLPHSALLSPPSWLTSAFHLFPGGQHADGRTANDLILFADGTYIELIAFLPHVTPEDRVKHRWGREPEGRFVDYALSLAADPSGTTEQLFAPIRDRVGAGSGVIRYTPPAPGGRTQRDGTEIKWAISAAERLAAGVTPVAPGELPFWCLDRTPRSLRVPYQEPENARHPSGAKGVAAVDVTVSAQEAQEVYRFIEDAEGREGRDGEKIWDLAVPEGPASTLRVSVGNETSAGGKEKIRLTVLTERGSEAKTIGGKIAEGVDLWIELKPEA